MDTRGSCRLGVPTSRLVLLTKLDVWSRLIDTDPFWSTRSYLLTEPAACSLFFDCRLHRLLLLLLLLLRNRCIVHIIHEYVSVYL